MVLTNQEILNCVELFNKYSDSEIVVTAESFIDGTLKGFVNTAYSNFARMNIVKGILGADNKYNIKQMCFVKAIWKLLMRWLPNWIAIPVIPLNIITDIDGNPYTYVTIGSQQWMVENLKTTKYADGTPIPNISNYNDYFLPSKDEKNAMYIELVLHSVGGFDTSLQYWSSSEAISPNAWAQQDSDGSQVSVLKSFEGAVRACRAFTSTTNYNLRDIGPAGGWIFWKSGNDYLETAPSDQSVSQAWSNITNIDISTTDTAIGSGQANTTAIINQVGHTDSAAKLCDDLTSDMLWSQDTIGAYCWYNNDIANKSPYGALYNWYAVDNVHGLAPIGWRVPSASDFSTLKVFLGGELVSGGKIKENGLVHWNTPNEGATNETNFSALASGRRSPTFVLIGDVEYFWTTETGDTSTAYILRYDMSSFLNSEETPINGFSVRCMRDIV